MFRQLISARFDNNFGHRSSSCHFSKKTMSLSATLHERLKHTDVNQNEKHVVNRIEHSVQPYGYLELSNADIDLCIKPANPDQFPDMTRAVIKFSSNDLEENKIPVLVQTGNKLTLDMPKSYKPNYSSCILEIPIKYGNNNNNHPF